jgi:hypothetical protein
MGKKRDVYFVSPNSDRGGWDVKREGAERASKHFETKADAIGFGKQVAQKSDLGQLKIQKQDGKIQTEYTYGKDPRSSKG